MKQYLVTDVDAGTERKMFSQDVVRFLKRKGVAPEAIDTKWLEECYIGDDGNEFEVTFWDIVE